MTRITMMMRTKKRTMGMMKRGLDVVGELYEDAVTFGPELEH